LRKWTGPSAPGAAALPAGNRLIDALPKSERSKVAARVRVLRIERGSCTQRQGQLVEHVDFPIDAVISVVATLESGATCEVALVGREGFVDIDAALTGTRSERSSFCQIAGNVIRMPVDAFRAHFATLPEFRRVLSRAMRVRLFITEQIASCNLKHSVLQRLARWLLMTSDRIHLPTVALTHEALALMLGTRRAGVSIAAASLQRAGLIGARRGAITLLDKQRLAEIACECYAITSDAVERSFRATPAP